MSETATTVVVETATVTLTVENLKFTFETEDTNSGNWIVSISNSTTHAPLADSRISNEYHTDAESVEEFAWEYTMLFLRKYSYAVVDFGHNEIELIED